MRARAVGAEVLAAVIGRRRSLNAVLLPRLRELHEPGERALAQELCYGTLRWYFRLDAVLSQLVRTPVKDPVIYSLLLIGLYQLLYLKIPPYAAVTETVVACAQLRRPWAKALVNAILRNCLRDSSSLLAKADRKEESRYAHPRWFLASFKRDWPLNWQAIATANNEHPPMWLRVNTRRITRGDYLQRLAKAGTPGWSVPYNDQAICLKQPVRADDLPGFSEGLVSVQDLAAQQAPPLLEMGPGQRVLDACAGPGGKSCHILEQAPFLSELWALECEAPRLDRIRENLQRLGLSARVVQSDAAAPEWWWDGKAFDRILLDAPCSGSGVIRRHPDIKLLRCETDIQAHAAVQRRLLEALWPLLKPGGLLLYATCSVFPEENEQLIQSVLRAHPDAYTVPFSGPWEKAPLEQNEVSPIGKYILPGTQGMDGFYYAQLRKLPYRVVSPYRPIELE